MEQGLVFDIQGFSVHDGPGSRTLVFLAGCPLRCEWCANPEGRVNKPCLLYAPSRCRAAQNGCSGCAAACSRHAVLIKDDAGIPEIDRGICVSCDRFECVEACSQEALRISAKYETPERLMEILNRDRRFWGAGGGVTFGGGEPLFQGGFLMRMLDLCRRDMIHTAIETCCYADEALFMDVMGAVDFAFVDVKHMDTDAHRVKTGVGNERILNNLRALSKSGVRSRTKRVILRMPIIPDFNDSRENALAAIDFMKQYGYFEINLLPFHRLGTSKWEQLGLAYPYGEQPNMAKEKLQPLQELYLDAGIACYVDTDVIYNFI